MSPFHPPSGRRINQHGLTIIKAMEGLRLRAYLDPNDGWTIGYGHLGPPAAPGVVITEEDAERLLLSDLAMAEECIERTTAPTILTDNQFSALVSFAFNVGCGVFMQSTMRRLLREGNHEAAAKQFRRWVFDDGVLRAGLIRRRALETILFTTPDGEPVRFPERLLTGADGWRHDLPW